MRLDIPRAQTRVLVCQTGALSYVIGYRSTLEVLQLPQLGSSACGIYRADLFSLAPPTLINRRTRAVMFFSMAKTVMVFVRRILSEAPPLLVS